MVFLYRNDFYKVDCSMLEADIEIFPSPLFTIRLHHDFLPDFFTR